MPLLFGQINHSTPRTRRKRPLSRFGADQVFERVLAITPEKLDVILAAIGPRLGLEQAGLPVMLAFDPKTDDDEEDDEYELRNGIAHIPVFGTLRKRASGLNARSGLTSYESLGKQITSAMDDPQVDGIVLECESPGGDADGMLQLSDRIYNFRGQKPMFAVADNQAASAAYALASAADRVYVTRTGMVGSVGCLAIHVDRSASDAARGLAYTLITSGAKKADGSSHAPLSPGARADIQDEVNRIAGMFHAVVARNRGVSEAAVRDTQAGVAYGERALGLFADRLGECEEACAAMRAALPAPRVYSLPPATPAALPAASQQRLLAGPAEAFVFHSNFNPSGELAATRERFRLEHPAIAAKFGCQVEARVVSLPQARASVSSADTRRIEMLVAPTGSRSIDLGGGLFERYQPGCWTGGLSGDIYAMHAHDEERILGRVAARTMQVWESGEGLRCVIPDAPDATWVDDLLENMRRGEVSGASAAFWIVQARVEIENGRRVRVVERAILRDCSVVAIPAYPESSASVSPSVNSLAANRARVERLRAQPSAVEQPTTAEARLRLERLKNPNSIELARRQIELLRRR